MADAYADVIVVGGGVAGLAAADLLSAEGKSVILLEGRARLGGRIETRHDPAWPLPIERGAEFIHGKPRESWEIVQAGGCCLYDVTDEHWVYEKGRLSKPEDFGEVTEEVLEVVERAWPRKTGRGKQRSDLSFDAFMASPAGRRVKPASRRWGRTFVEGFNAADAREVSCAWLAEAQRASKAIEGDRLFRVYSGYDKVVQFLKTGLGDQVRVELSTTVKRIKWGKEGFEGGDVNGVVVETVGSEGSELEHTPRTFEARRVVITVPLGVLQVATGPGAITFEPSLPEEKREAIGRLRMGSVVKAILRFQEAFWEKRMPELDFIHAPGDGKGVGFPTWWTTLPIRTPVLTGWAGGPAADALSGQPTGDILAVAVSGLGKILGMTTRAIEGQLLGAHVCDWKAEPLSRGAYSYAAVGGAGAARALAKPLAGTLFFAGEATHGGMSGTVAGAIASGRRAGREVLAE